MSGSRHPRAGVQGRVFFLSSRTGLNMCSQGQVTRTYRLNRQRIADLHPVRPSKLLSTHFSHTNPVVAELVTDEQRTSVCGDV